MKIILPLRVPSDNELWQGKRFRSPLYKKFQADAGWLLKGYSKPYKAGEPLRMVIRLYWHRAGLRDLSNAFKGLLDALVKYEAIPDDRYIYELTATKQKISTSEPERVEIEITHLAPTETGV